MDPTREAARLADEFESHFARRKDAVEAWNKALDDGTYRPSAMQRFRWKATHALTGFGSPDGRRKVGLAMALSDTFTFQFWIAGESKAAFGACLELTFALQQACSRSSEIWVRWSLLS